MAPDAGGNGLDAPTDVSAIANIDHGVRLSWTAPVGTVTTYTITGSPAGGTVQVVDTQALVTGLDVGTSYTFTVTATNDSGAGPASEPSTAVTVVAGPAAPTNLVACGADGQITVRADAPGATSFNVYFDANQGVTELSPNKTSSPSFPFVHTGRSNGQPLHYVVTAVDANGIESLDSSEDVTTPDTAVHDSLYASSFRNDTFIEVVDCFSKYKTGTTPPARDIGGAAVGIVSADYNELALDPTKALLYYRNPSAILVFSNATKVTGNTAPTRTLTSAALGGGRGIAIDTTRDLLYVLEGDNSVLVFANASTANGAVTPLHTISGAAFSNAGGIAIDTTNDRLYVADLGNVLVFNNASTANGAIAATRTITISGATLAAFGVAVDVTNDILYIGSRNVGDIYSVPASTANGAVVPTRTITGLNVPMGVGVFGNRLFSVSDNNSDLVSAWNNADNQNGAVAPDALIQLPTITAESGFAYAP